MEAAAHGHSTLGIPKSVGQEFVDADAPAHDALPRAAGTLFTLPDGRALFLRRGPHGDEPGTWALPAGGLEPGETAAQAARREAIEELGHYPAGEPEFVHRHQHNGVDFATFHQAVPEEFEPTLNDESAGFAWVDPALAPHPLHPGVAAMLADRAAAAERRFDWAPGQLEVLHVGTEPAPGVEPDEADEIDESEVGEPTVELEISE